MSKTAALPTTSASMVAKYFLWRAHEDGKSLTNKKLQKLLYYAQAWHLTLNDAPLFRDNIEAWIHGPAVRSVYGEYKQYGFSSITVNVSEIDASTIPGHEVLSAVWRVYGKYDGDYLERLSHSELPWQLAREDMETHEHSSNIISHESMRDFYRSKLKSAK